MNYDIVNEEELAAMAADAEIQQELAVIREEFACIGSDGLEDV